MNLDHLPEFEGLMRSLYGALDLPLSADKLSGLWDGIGSKLSKVELTRIREAVLADMANPDRREHVFGFKGRFGVSELWAARDRLRVAPPRPSQPMPMPASIEERWEQARAGRVGRYLCQHFARHSHPADLPPMLTVEGLRSPDYRPHPVSLELREPIYEAGRGWAAEMRLQTRALGVEPRADSQREVWQVLLVAAEAAVDAIRAQHELPHPAAPKGAAAARVSRALNNIATPEAA